MLYSYFIFTRIVTIVCGVLLVTDVTRGYTYSPEAYGWIVKHQVIATWEEAFEQCQAEGAVLMSPTTLGHLKAMRSVIGNSYSYHIGTRSMFHPRIFESAEGIALEDMPVTEMLGPIDPKNGQCLKMTRDSIGVVSCSSRMPYICYKENKSELTECGTFDKGYKLNNITGSCYKYHQKSVPWDVAYWTCSAENAYLAIVNNNQEAQALTHIMTDKGVWVYIGLRDWRGNGDWISVHRQPLQELHNVWLSEKPPKNPCCDVASINPTSGKLREWAEGVLYYFLCEKDPNNVRFPTYDQQ